MRLKLILCEVFRREICKAMLESSHSIFPVFMEKRSHEFPNNLREMVQKEIDKTDPIEFQAILLGFGLCGNAISGLAAREIPLVIPRAHDCCTVLLGSRDSFIRNFGHRPSTQWTSGGYIESGDNYLRDTETFRAMGLDMDYQQLVLQYGEENAQFLLETLAPKDNSDKHIIYIQTTPYRNMDYREKIELKALREGKTVELLDGDERLLSMLVKQEWPEDEFLTVPPNHHVEGVYDQDIIIKAVP